MYNEDLSAKGENYMGERKSRRDKGVVASAGYSTEYVDEVDDNQREETYIPALS